MSSSFPHHQLPLGLASSPAPKAQSPFAPPPPPPPPPPSTVYASSPNISTLVSPVMSMAGMGSPVADAASQVLVQRALLGLSPLTSPVATDPGRIALLRAAIEEQNTQAAWASLHQAAATERIAPRSFGQHHHHQQLPPPPPPPPPAIVSPDVYSVTSPLPSPKLYSNTTTSSNNRVYIDQLRDTDVLCGRGGKSNHHPANKRYRRVVREYKALYRSVACKTQKTDLSRAIVEHVCNNGGRFVKQDAAGRYYVLTMAEARKKTSQALRETKDLKHQQQQARSNDAMVLE